METEKHWQAILIRVPPALKVWVEQEARAHDCSISKEVYHVLMVVRNERQRKRQQPKAQSKNVTTFARRCPRDFMPSNDTQAWAAMKYPHIDLLAAQEALMDHEFPRPRSDWDATLRNWIRKEDQFRRANGKREENTTLTSTERAAAIEEAARRRHGRE